MNRLANETSAYLLQHATNPVDWHPWGKEALAQARRENKPIFLSIGYSACHWCHVMERESFEDSETAEILKNYFISIKVDREERPDLDHIYMSAVQALTQRGGWPLTVFLTPDLKPFYGGTYFPPSDRMGLPSFKKVLLGIANAWKSRPQEIRASAEELTQALIQMSELGTRNEGSTEKLQPLDPFQLTQDAFQKMIPRIDFKFGGLGNSPKFFHSMEWRLCLRFWKKTQDPQALAALETTLGQWSRGGIYDHLGGGFHRYSTDKRWFVPHFEKMLYDNALVTQLYLEAFQATQKVQYAKTARETLDYVLRQMTHSQGGYFSTEDADSEGIEGKFYVWSLSEVESILDKETAQLFCEAYGITKHGNWEENNILHLPTELSQFCQNKNIELAWLEDSLEKAKRKLLDQRNHRIAPNRDEKIIVSWNGLMIEAMAFSFQVLGDTNYLESAQRAAHFILDYLQQTEEGHLHHSFQEGRAQFNALLDDYACFANGLLSLFESDFNSLWISQAEKLLKLMLREFWDESQNTFFYTPKTHEALILRPKEFQDGALPSASGMAITALARLGKLTGNPLYLEHAEKALKSHRDFLQQAPMACGQMLLALELIGPGSKEIIIIPEKSDETVETALDYLRSTFYPNKIIALKTEENAHLALFKNRTSLNGTTTLYICENQTCLTPITDVELLKGLLSG